MTQTGNKLKEKITKYPSEVLGHRVPSQQLPHVSGLDCLCWKQGTLLKHIHSFGLLVMVLLSDMLKGDDCAGHSVWVTSFSYSSNHSTNSYALWMKVLAFWERPTTFRSDLFLEGDIWSQTSPAKFPQWVRDTWRSQAYKPIPFWHTRCSCWECYDSYDLFKSVLQPITLSQSSFPLLVLMQIQNQPVFQQFLWRPGVMQKINYNIDIPVSFTLHKKDSYSDHAK